MSIHPADVKMYENPELKDPLVLAAWPGMGNVALRAVDYIREKLQARYFAQIDTQAIIAPELVNIEHGLAALP